jgi:putative Mn2+ efflux pump MntP
MKKQERSDFQLDNKSKCKMTKKIKNYLSSIILLVLGHKVLSPTFYKKKKTKMVMGTSLLPGNKIILESENVPVSITIKIRSPAFAL